MGIIDTLLWLYSLVILGRVIISYFPQVNPDIARFLYQATEPVLAPIRQVLPPMGGFDLSPLVVLVIIQILQRIF